MVPGSCVVSPDWLSQLSVLHEFLYPFNYPHTRDITTSVQGSESSNVTEARSSDKLSPPHDPTDHPGRHRTRYCSS